MVIFTITLSHHLQIGLHISRNVKAGSLNYICTLIWWHCFKYYEGFWQYFRSIFLLQLATIHIIIRTLREIFFFAYTVVYNHSAVCLNVNNLRVCTMPYHLFRLPYPLSAVVLHSVFEEVWKAWTAKQHKILREEKREKRSAQWYLHSIACWSHKVERICLQN